MFHAYGVEGRKKHRNGAFFNFMSCADGCTMEFHFVNLRAQTPPLCELPAWEIVRTVYQIQNNYVLVHRYSDRKPHVFYRANRGRKGDGIRSGCL